jgi:nucleoside phosphorylase
MLQTWRPRCLLVADIGGGVAGRDGLALGDVVALETLHYYELRKRTESGSLPRAIALLPPAQRLLALARDAQRSTSWYHSIQLERPEDPPEEQAPEVEGEGQVSTARAVPELTYGEFLVGEKLLTDPDDPLVAELLEEFDKAKAVEMESAGIAHAVWSSQDIGGPQFLVLRGISDYVNRRGNQKTRDNWKPYAAEAALAAAKAIIELERYSAPQQTPQRQPEPATDFLGDYLQRLAVDVAEDPSRPRFLITVEVDGSTQPALNIGQIIKQHRRIVLLAQAGAGKTELLRRLARDVGPERVPVLVDLKRWTPDHSAALLNIFAQGLLMSGTEAVDLLLRLAAGDIGVDLLQRAVQHQRVLLMVDGLNEVDPEVADRLIDTLNDYVRSHENASVLVTDRVHRDRYTEDWKPVLVNTLGEDIVTSHLDSHFPPGTYAQRSDEERALLAVPFFLALAVEGTTPELGSRAEALERFFLEQVGLSQSEMNSAAQSALDVYLRKASRSFESEEMKTSLGDEVWSRLTDAKVISRSGNDYRFEHQLYHDFLVSVAVLPVDRKRWTHELLDAVTFRASSIDPLTFALSQADGASQGDELLRALEDWNWRVTVRVMGAVEKERQLDVSQSLRIALLANLAEKRFDPVAASAGDADELLERFDDDEAASMRSANNAIELAQIVARMAVPSPEGWYDEWRELFTRQQQLTDGTIRELTHPEGLHGWTAANVIRRFPLTEVQEQELRDLYASRWWDDDPRSESIRWRAIHAMGSAISRDVVTSLLEAAENDRYPWAKYGAIRSLLEIAARENELRDSVFDGLRKLLAKFDAHERLQLVRSANQATVADGWCAAVRPLVNDVSIDNLSEREQANLRRLLDDFDEGCD